PAASAAGRVHGASQAAVDQNPPATHRRGYARAIRWDVRVTTIFSGFVTGGDVRDAVEATVRLWIDDYLGVVAAHDGRDALPTFRSYAPALDLDHFVEDQLPSCVIVAPGMSDVPRLKADGSYVGTWSVGVGAVVS